MPSCSPVQNWEWGRLKWLKRERILEVWLTLSNFPVKCFSQNWWWTILHQEDDDIVNFHAFKFYLLIISEVFNRKQSEALRNSLVDYLFPFCSGK